MSVEPLNWWDDPWSCTTYHPCPECEALVPLDHAEVGSKRHERVFDWEGKMMIDMLAARGLYVRLLFGCHCGVHWAHELAEGDDGIGIQQSGSLHGHKGKRAA